MTNPGDFSHVDDFFGGGGKSLHFDAAKGYQRGTPKGGVIVEIKGKQQATDLKTKQPRVWDDGNPVWTLPITLLTSERDADTPHDDGKRTLWVQGGVERAIREHLRETGSKLRPGGTLLVAWVSGEGAIGDAKQYRAHYTPAAQNDADAMFAAAPAAQPAAPAPTPQPAAPQWGGAPAQPTQPAWGQQPSAQPAAPLLGGAPTQQPQPDLWGGAPAQPAPNGVDLDAAYAHLSPDQRAAIKASGMSPEQIASVFGPPQGAAA